MCAISIRAAAVLVSEATGWAWGVYSPDLLRLEVDNRAYYLAWDREKTVEQLAAEANGLMR